MIWCLFDTRASVTIMMVGDALWISVVSQRQTGYKRGRLNINISYQYVRIHVVKMRRSHDRVDFIMGILYMG